MGPGRGWPVRIKTGFTVHLALSARYAGADDPVDHRSMVTNSADSELGTGGTMRRQTLSSHGCPASSVRHRWRIPHGRPDDAAPAPVRRGVRCAATLMEDRKSTRLNSSH